MRFSDDLADASDPDDADGREDPEDPEDPELEAELDRDFPLGDGTADTEATVACPYCGEEVALALDPGSGTVQEYVEDCQVCCQPWHVSVLYSEDGRADVSVVALDA